MRSVADGMSLAEADIQSGDDRSIWRKINLKFVFIYSMLAYPKNRG